MGNLSWEGIKKQREPQRALRERRGLMECGADLRLFRLGVFLFLETRVRWREGSYRRLEKFNKGEKDGQRFGNHNK